MTGTDQYSFTDVPVFLAPPARLLAGQFAQFGQIPRETHAATVNLLHAFFNHALNGQPLAINSMADRYECIIRKPIDP